MGAFAVAASVFLMISRRILREITTGIATISWLSGIGLINAYGPNRKPCRRVLE